MNTVHDDQMNPDASPGATKGAGVRRVNNRPMYIGGALLGIFLLVMAAVAMDRASQKNDQHAKVEKGGDTSMLAKQIAGEKQAGVVPPLMPPMDAASAPLTPASGEVLVPAAPPPMTVAATPPGAAMPPQQMLPPQPQNDATDGIKSAKLQQLEQAVRARLGVSPGMARSSGSAYGGAPQSRQDALDRIAAVRSQINAQVGGGSDVMGAYQARLQQVQAAGLGDTGGGVGGAGAGIGNLNMPPNPPGNRVALAGQDGRWSLNSAVMAPGSAYELRAGFVLPATLISGINSELPGQIIGQVSQDVYDTPTGQHKLIPQGSRLVGQYSSETQFGQKRVLIAWNRIIFPDGKALDIGSMPGSDGAGYSGLNDKVDSHYLRIFGSALLMSGVTAAITLSTDKNAKTQDGNAKTVSGALNEALGQQIGQVAAQLIGKNMNTAPTLQIRPGYRFNVVVMKDMTFSKPYQAYDY